MSRQGYTGEPRTCPLCGKGDDCHCRKTPRLNRPRPDADHEAERQASIAEAQKQQDDNQEP